MSVDLGLLILRVVVGLAIAAHGAQKLFGWFGGPGFKGTTGWIGSLGLRPAAFWALLAGLSEFGGGLLLVLGLLNPIGSLGVMAAMAMAMVKVHWSKGFWNMSGGVELPLLNFVSALALAVSGPGAYALDSVLKIALPVLPILVLGLIAIGVSLALPVQQQPAEQAKS